MFMSYLILIFSAALFFFYLQHTCQRIVRREFEEEYSRPIVKANRLAFCSIREALEQLGQPAEYSRFRTALQCDFLMLTYMLKHAANVSERYTPEERLLMLYFRLASASLFVSHLLKIKQKSTI